MKAMMRIAIVALLLLSTAGIQAASSGSSPAPLRAASSVESTRAPWPDRTLVLLWLESGIGRIYPLPLLDRHGVILDAQRGRRVAATWSPLTGSAVLVALPGQVSPQSADLGLGGWRRVVDPALQSAWLPGKAAAISGPAKERLEPIPESMVLPLRRARQLSPTAEVVISQEPPASLNRRWQETRKRTLIPTLKERLTLVMARGEASAWRHGALPRDGLIETTIKGLKVLVIRAHYITRAFMSPMTPTLHVATDPWTGAPMLWTEGIGLWNGLSGARLDTGHSATQALPTFELSLEAFKAHWPNGVIHDRDASPDTPEQTP